MEISRSVSSPWRIYMISDQVITGTVETHSSEYPRKLSFYPGDLSVSLPARKGVFSADVSSGVPADDWEGAGF